MSIYSDISRTAYRRREEAAARLSAERGRFVELLGGDDPYLDGWLKDIAAEFFARRGVAASAGKLQAAEDELLDDKRAIGRVLRFVDTVNWTLPSDFEVMLRVLPALAQIADKRVKSLRALRKPHRQSGSSEKAVPQHTLAALAAVFRVITGTDPLAVRSNASPFCDFVRLFLRVIGAKDAVPDDLWRNIRVSLKQLRWLENTAEVHGLESTTVTVEAQAGISPSGHSTTAGYP